MERLRSATIIPDKACLKTLSSTRKNLRKKNRRIINGRSRMFAHSLSNPSREAKARLQDLLDVSLNYSQ